MVSNGKVKLFHRIDIFVCYSNEQYYDVGAKRQLCMIPTDFSALRASKIRENIRNPLIFLRKMATSSCFCGPKVSKMDASIHLLTF